MLKNRHVDQPGAAIVFVCPFDAHWCSLPACRTGVCEITNEKPLIACLECGVVTASSPGLRLCIDCFGVLVEATIDEG